MIFVFVILIQLNCNKYNSVERLWLFNLLFNVRTISIKSFADASSSNITKLPILILPGPRQEVVFWIAEGNRKRERRKGKEFLVHWVGIRINFRIKKNNFN
jgi:hypothetical protein